MTTREELQLKWKHLKNCYWKKGASIDHGWEDFEVFYKDNYSKYCRAKRKWKNYKKIGKGKLKNNNVRMIRKNPDLPFSKNNIVFTSLSDSMKYHKNSYNIYIENRRLGTRDVKNILKKSGISISTIGVSQRFRNKTDIFRPNYYKNFKWKGVFMKLEDVASKEKILYTQLSNRIYHYNESLEQAVNHCKKYKEPTYEFEGKQLFPNEIVKILSKRSGIKESLLLGRFYNQNQDFNKMISDIISKKEIIVLKNNLQAKFYSIKEAARLLKLSFSQISCMVNNTMIHKQGFMRGYKFRYSTNEDLNVKHFLNSKLISNIDIDFEIDLFKKHNLTKANYKTAVIVNGKLIEKECVKCNKIKKKFQFKNNSNTCKKCRENQQNKAQHKYWLKKKQQKSNTVIF